MSLPHILSRNHSPVFNDDEDVDDKGNPLTVRAALRIYHKKEKNKKLYCPEQSFRNHKDSLNQLTMKRQHIQNMIMRAREEQINKTSEKLGHVIKTDLQTLAMPVIRVQPKQTLKSKSNFEQQEEIFSHRAGNNMKEKRQSRIDYDWLAQKAQKQLSLQNSNPHYLKELEAKLQPGGGCTFEPATVNHKFKKEITPLRDVFKSIYHKNQNLPHVMIQNYDSLGPHESIEQFDMLSEGSLPYEASQYYQLGSPRVQDQLNQVDSKPPASLRGQTGPASRQKDYLNCQLGNLSSNGSKERLQINNIQNPRNHDRRIRGSSLNKRSLIADSLSVSNSQSSLNTSARRPSILVQNKMILDIQAKNITQRKLAQQRCMSFVKLVNVQSENEDSQKALFQSKRNDQLPNNKLIDELRKGLTLFVQRMQVRESFYVTIKKVSRKEKWTPPPRECATLTFSVQDQNAYLIGGLNFDVSREVAQISVYDKTTDDLERVRPEWQNINYGVGDQSLGRCKHTSCEYEGRIYTFGGCFMYNRKKLQRECTSEITVYNTTNQSYKTLQTRGTSVRPRKDHMAAIVGKSMIIYGGEFENGDISDQLLNFDLEYHDFKYVEVKQSITPITQGACVTVINQKKKKSDKKVRLSDAFNEGIYFFGGKNAKGELKSNLKYLKPTMNVGKVVSLEWNTIKQTGVPPCGRTGHTMTYLPVNWSLLVVGGRNDEVCKSLNTPFLDDIHMFMLDQKSWITIQYTPFSERLYRLGNHSMCCITDGSTFEKVVIFGGHQQQPQQAGESTSEQSQLSNDTFIIEVRQLM